MPYLKPKDKIVAWKVATSLSKVFSITVLSPGEDISDVSITTSALALRSPNSSLSFCKPSSTRPSPCNGCGLLLPSNLLTSETSDASRKRTRTSQLSFLTAASALSRFENSFPPRTSTTTAI